MVQQIKLPILERLVDESTKLDCIPTLAIQHLKPDTYQFFKELLRVGFNPIIISGIEYSTDKDVLKQLEKDGHKIKNPENKKLFDPNYWDDFIGSDIDDWKNKSIEYIVLEDGAYIGKTFHESRPKYLENCKGAVEQTTNGFWQYQLLEKTNRLKIPVFSVAQSKLKELAEAPEVSLAIAKMLEANLDKLSDSLNNKIVTVLGFGSIGKNVANAIKSRNPTDVLIFDLNSIRMIEARFSGFTTVNKEVALQNADIIIGCTGKESISHEDFDLVKDGVIIASGTSKKVEFDIQWLNDNSTQINKIGTAIVFEILSKKITILAEGQPINFEANVSVSPETMDIVISEMFLCMQKIIVGGLDNKTYTISPQDEQRVSDLWLEIYG